jgi:FMN-dependent NADH-azoreductase
MSHLLRIDSSLRHHGSFSRSVGDTFQRAWLQAHPDGTVQTRDLGKDPLPYLTDADMAAKSRPEHERTPREQAAASRSAELVDELLAADAILLGVPLYNWGLPASVKTWLDHVFADPRTLGQQPLLAGRAAVLVNAHGGSYKPGTPREGWDYAEPYLRRILADVFGLDLQVITPELTLADVAPALAEFRDHAQVSLRQAHELADAHAQALAQRSYAA